MYGPIQINRREVADLIRRRLDVSPQYARSLAAALGDDHVRAILQSARHGPEIGDTLLSETIYQHRIRMATEERIRNLEALARRRLATRDRPTGESKTRRRITRGGKPPEDPLQRKLFR